MNILTSLSVLGSLTYPSKLSKTLNLEGSDTLKLTLQIKDKATQAGIQPHQAFLLLTNEDTDVDSVQVLEVANSGRGKVELVSVISRVLKQPVVYGPRPVIQHVFRTPEKMPPAAFSAGIILSPWLLLLIGVSNTLLLISDLVREKKKYLPLLFSGPPWGSLRCLLVLSSAQAS